MTASLTRRALIAGLSSAPLLAALPRAWAAPSPALEFDILRNNSRIGEHVIASEATGQGLEVAIDTDINVRVLGLSMYRYRHSSREQWQEHEESPRLTRLSSRTDDNGKPLTVQGEAVEGAFRIEGSEGSVTAPGEIVPASYWTSLVLQRDQLLSTTRGTLFPIAVEPRGSETLESAGEQVGTERFFIAGDPAVHLWFDERRRVRRLAFETRGEFIDYRLRRMDPFGVDQRVF